MLDIGAFLLDFLDAWIESGLFGVGFLKRISIFLHIEQPFSSFIGIVYGSDYLAIQENSTQD